MRTSAYETSDLYVKKKISAKKISAEGADA